MSAIGDIFGAGGVAGLIKDGLDKIWPDKTEAERAQAALVLEKVHGDIELQKQAAGIVQAEASSNNWLTSAWRPVTMLVFVGLITARWFGWAAPNLEPAEYLKLWDIVQLGLGGYVIGRSVEKVAPAVADAMKR